MASASSSALQEEDTETSGVIPSKSRGVFRRLSAVGAIHQFAGAVEDFFEVESVGLAGESTGAVKLESACTVSAVGCLSETGNRNRKQLIWLAVLGGIALLMLAASLAVVVDACSYGTGRSGPPNRTRRHRLGQDRTVIEPRWIPRWT